MPEGLAASMTSDERRDLVRFLLDLGRPGQSAAGQLLAHSHTPATFSYDRAPLHPEDWPSWRHPVNRDRVYDFYAKEAEYFSKQPNVPALLPPYPGLDGGTLGHWGNQSDATWVDGRWNQTDLGTLLCGVFRGAGVTVPKGGLRPARRSGRALRLLQPRDPLLRGRLDRRLPPLRPQAPRPARRHHPRRHPPAPPRGQEARPPVRVSRVLPPRQPDRLLVPDRRRRDARRPLGRGWPVHPRRRTGRASIRSAHLTRAAAARRDGPRC